VKINLLKDIILFKVPSLAPLSQALMPSNAALQTTEQVVLAYKAKLTSHQACGAIIQFSSTTLKLKGDIDISKYNKVNYVTKRTNKGYKPKKLGIFTKEHVNKFLIEVRDEDFLHMKVRTYH
jgi:hypothetical protein